MLIHFNDQHKAVIVSIVIITNPGADVTHVYWVIVSTTVGVLIHMTGILPGLLQPKIKAIISVMKTNL